MTTTTTVALATLAGLVTPVLAGHPTALIQTTGSGANASIDGNAFGSIDRPTKNGTGSKFIVLTRVNGTSQEALITGDATGINLVALEGVTELEPGRTWGTIDRYADINEAGDWVHIANLNGGASNDDEALVRGNFDGSTITIALREGDTLPTGDTLGSANYGPSIADNRDLSFGWSSPTSTSDISYYTQNGITAVLRNGDTISFGSFNGIFSTDGFGGRNAFQTTPDASSYVVRGTELVSEAQTLVKDDIAVLVAGDAINTIGGLKTIEQINGEQNILQANGDWLTRVRFTDGTGGAIKNGQLLAASGDLVNGQFGPNERWSELPWTSSSDTTFFIVTGDSNGNVVLGGFTNILNQDVNAVWTYNGEEFLRSGDQIDLDADGTLDDAFIFTSNFFSASQNLGGFLADDGLFYQVADIRNAAGDDLGEALIVAETPGFTGGPCSIADLAMPFDLIDIDDVDAFIAAFIANDPAADLAPAFGIIDIDDVDAFIAAFLAGCP